MDASCWLETELFPARQRFHVQSDQGRLEVSWTKLLKLVPQNNGTITSSPHHTSLKPGLEARIAPEVVSHHKDVRAVIGKIEKLYQGFSDDEQEDGEQQHENGAHTQEDYNTDDSFIDDEELDEYFTVDKTETMHSGFYINKGELEKKPVEAFNIDESSGLKLYKKRRRITHERVPTKKIRSEDDEGQNPSVIKTAVNSPTIGSKTSTAKTMKSCQSGSKTCSKSPLAEQNAQLVIDFFAVPANSNDIEKTKEPSPGKKAGPKLTMLDRAIQELEKEVAERCPASTEKNHENENKKRIPKEVKTRLAKVARLAQKQNKLSEDLVESLMKIMGHLMQLRSLKRNLKEMVELGLSAQKEKQCKLETMKKEIIEMVKSRITPQQSAEDNSQCVGYETVEKRSYTWDTATEDRISDLYELYLDGIDEHKSAATKKFYAELAELWPDGWMDNNGIKSAVLRAKERKKGALKQAKIEERKRKKLSTTKPAKKPDSPQDGKHPVLQLCKIEQQEQQEQDRVIANEAEGLRSSIVVLNPNSNVMRRDCPAGVTTMVPSSLRQIKRTLLDKASNRNSLHNAESFCCNSDVSLPPSSLMWMSRIQTQANDHPP